MLLDMIVRAFERITELEAEVADLKQRLSRKPKIKTTQVQLKLEFWGGEERRGDTGTRGQR